MLNPASMASEAEVETMERWLQLYCTNLHPIIWRHQGLDRAWSDLAIASNIRDVLEESYDNREEEHEADGEDQWPREHQSTVTQALLHVKVKAELDHDCPAERAQIEKLSEGRLICIRPT